jgi:hypothetical protein
VSSFVSTSFRRSMMAGSPFTSSPPLPLRERLRSGAREPVI